MSLVPLDKLKRGSRAEIVEIDWAMLETADANRLRDFGFDPGVVVQYLHTGPFGRDPLAIKVGRMIVAIRRRQAAAVRVLPTA